MTGDRERKWQLYPQHPDACPHLIFYRTNFLLCMPSKTSPTATWRIFRDNLPAMIRRHPDNPNLPNILKQAEIVLAYRATQSSEDRFWKADP